MTSMTNITFRNVDMRVLQDFKAEAVRENKTFGQALAEALSVWLLHKRAAKQKKLRISSLHPTDFGPGTEDLSGRIDEEVYG